MDVWHQETTDDLIQTKPVDVCVQAEHRQTDQKDGKDERERRKERAECQATLIVSILESEADLRRVSVKVT